MKRIVIVAGLSLLVFESSMIAMQIDIKRAKVAQEGTVCIHLKDGRAEISEKVYEALLENINPSVAELLKVQGDKTLTAIGMREFDLILKVLVQLNENIGKVTENQMLQIVYRIVSSKSTSIRGMVLFIKATNFLGLDIITRSIQDINYMLIAQKNGKRQIQK